jgi:hypothetical protein
MFYGAAFVRQLSAKNNALSPLSELWARSPSSKSSKQQVALSAKAKQTGRASWSARHFAECSSASGPP